MDGRLRVISREVLRCSTDLLSTPFPDFVRDNSFERIVSADTTPSIKLHIPRTTTPRTTIKPVKALTEVGRWYTTGADDAVAVAEEVVDVAEAVASSRRPCAMS